RAEPGFAVNLLVPAGELLFVRSRDREAEVQLRPGQTVGLGELAFRHSGVRPRDALASSLRRGLFATSFGPAYYRGFVDRAPDLVAVEVGSEPPVIAADLPPPVPPSG